MSRYVYRWREWLRGKIFILDISSYYNPLYNSIYRVTTKLNYVIC